jgi:spermidine/putrescine transport system ATP-binding protein
LHTHSSAETVRFSNVSKSFGSTVAVDSVSFDIAPGEFFSLLGPSGCGKTTTLRLLAGFERPDADGGEIHIGGALVNGKRPYERNLGMVFQNYALFPHLTVERNVAFGLEQRRVPKAEIPGRVRRALEMVRLPPDTYARRKPGELSGGQKQRVALARALVVEPPILLLDEPLGALDLKLRKDMQLELKALNRESGITFVYVTHDQEEALTMSDRIAVMDSARIAQIGTPAEIYEQPRTAFVARFIGESSFIEGKVVARQDERVTVERPDGSRVEVCGDRSVGARARVSVRPENLALEPVNGYVNGHNAINGTVSQLIYRGEMLHVRVAVDAGEDILVALRNRGQLRSPVPWQQGQRVNVIWEVESGCLLEDDEA